MGNGGAVRHIEQYTEARGQLHALAASPPLKDAPNPVDRKLFGLQYGLDMVEKTKICSSVVKQKRFLSRPSLRQATLRNELLYLFRNRPHCMGKEINFNAISNYAPYCYKVG